MKQKLIEQSLHLTALEESIIILAVGTISFVLFMIWLADRDIARMDKNS
jgi:hypothetical protein